MSPHAHEAEAFLKIAAKRMVRAYPFHAHLISLGRLVEEPDVTTMGVTIRGGELLFLYDASFVLGCDLEQLVGVLHHEVLHVLLGHLFLSPEDYPDAVALTIAEEVTVNEFVPEPLPGHPVVLKQFPQLPTLEDTVRRYRRLDRGNGGRPRGRPVAGQVSTVDNHGSWQEARDEGQTAAAVIMSAVERAAGKLTPDEHARIPENARDLIEAARRGNAAGRTLAAVRSGETGTVSWQKVLRRFVGRQTLLQASYLRPPRRFPELVGILPGSTRKPGKPRVMAVIDTSGSITDALLGKIARELVGLGASYEVVILECDAVVHRIYPFKGELRDVCGRGGTDLCPPFDRAVLAKVRPDVLLYFTDGQGMAPKSAPRLPVLWCLTPGASAPVTWGQRVWMT